MLLKMPPATVLTDVMVWLRQPGSGRRGPSDPHQRRSRPHRRSGTNLLGDIFRPRISTGTADKVPALEADALAYAVNGYSGVLRVSLANGLNIALGAGRYEVPGFIVEGQASYEEAGWKATSESIQVLRIGYRFRQAMENGPVLDGVIINQRWKVVAERIGGETKFSPLGIGMSGGYYFHIGRHFYLYPTASLTYNVFYSGTTTVQGLDYRVPQVQPNGSLHVGWEMRL
jgi:hypothetical protein